MRECRTHICSRTVAIVGQRFAVDSNACRTIAFVDDRLIVRRILTGAKRLIDSGLDLIFRKRVALSLIDRSSQGCIVVGVRVAAFFRRYRDVTREL